MFTPPLPADPKNRLVKKEMQSFFFVRPFARFFGSPFLRVAVWSNFSGTNFVFRWFVVVLCFRSCFAEVFILWCGVSLPKLF